MANLPSGTETTAVRFRGRVNGVRERARPPVKRVPPESEPEPVERVRRGGLSQGIGDLNRILDRQAGDAQRIANAITKDAGGGAGPGPTPPPVPVPPVPVPPPPPPPVPVPPVPVPPAPQPKPEPDSAALAHAAAVLTLAIGGFGGASDAAEGEWFKKAGFSHLDDIIAVTKEQFATRLERALRPLVNKGRSALMSAITPASFPFIYDAARIAQPGVPRKKTKT